MHFVFISNDSAVNQYVLSKWEKIVSVQAYFKLILAEIRYARRCTWTKTKKAL